LCIQCIRRQILYMFYCSWQVIVHKRFHSGSSLVWLEAAQRRHQRTGSYGWGTATLELFGREPIQRILTRVKGELAKQWNHSIRHATPHAACCLPNTRHPNTRKIFNNLSIVRVSVPPTNSTQPHLNFCRVLLCAEQQPWGSVPDTHTWRHATKGQHFACHPTLINCRCGGT
jgi:hypothetical protein